MFVELWRGGPSCSSGISRQRVGTPPKRSLFSGRHDTAYDEDANTGYTGNGLRAVATLRNLALSLLYLAGV
jgi:hypothetical protein